MNAFLFECITYLMVAGAIQLVAFGFLSVFAPLALDIRETTFRRVLRVYFIFNLFLLFWGALGNYVFLHLTLGKLYTSVDRLVDWLPFIPFNQGVLDRSLGDLHGQLLGGATLGQVRLIWLAVAAPVWLLTSVSTWLVYRLMEAQLTLTPANRIA